MVGDLNLGTLIASIINFILLLVVLRAFAYKPILGVLEGRRKRIAESLAKAEADRAEAERLREEAARELAEAKREAQSFLDRAQRAAAQEEADILARAREEAARLVSAAREEIEGEKRKALHELQAGVADLVVTLAEKLMRQRLNSEEGHRLVREFIAGESRLQ